MPSPAQQHPQQLSGLIERQIHRWDRISEALRHRPGAAPAVEVSYRPVITISGAAGTGRMLLAKALAAKLDYEIYGRELVDRVALDLGLDQPIVDGLDERVESEIRLLFSTWMRGHEIESTDYIRALARVIMGVARIGGAVIVGRGGPFILQNMGDYVGAAVRLVAPMPVRIQRITEILRVDEDQARRIAEQNDHDQEHFIRHYFHRDIADPLAYDLVINTGRLGIESAVGLILELLRQWGYSAERLAQRAKEK